MKKLFPLINLVLLISMQWAMAQTDNLRMSDLREINYQVVKLIGDYETYSAFSGTDDYNGFKSMFASADAFVYCDVLFDNRLDDKVGLNEYLDIVKGNYIEAGTVVKVNKINLPSFKGKTGSIDVEIQKTVSGLNKCNTNYKDVFNLIVTVSFQVSAGLYENFKISEIGSKMQKGKSIVLIALGPKGKVLTNQPFMINGGTFSTDINGKIIYHYKNKNDSLIITPLNNEYVGIIRYNNYQDLLANSKKGTSPCEPGVVEFTVEKAAALATITNPDKKETKKEKLAREKYEKVIAEAEVLLTDKKYLEAKTNYQSALKIKPGDKYSQQKINEIDIALSEIKTRNESYNKAVAEGDVYYNTAKYKEALESYQRAISIKPEEKYSHSQIDKINGIFAELREKEESYASLVAEADRLLEDKKYSEAKAAYQSALKFKPEELYLKQKITEIDLAQNRIITSKDSYNEAIAEGDKYYNAAKYSEAFEPYRRAIAIKPQEKYPVEQINKINGILTELKKKDENYSAQIAKADKLMEDKKYSEAISLYNKALVIKPGEKYPKEKISTIKSILARISSVSEQYAQAISDGNASFTAKEYEKALGSYKTAQQLKPEELFPKEKIAQTETEIKRLNDSYVTAIADGDNKLGAKHYQDALDAFNQALKIKPGEKYPLDKINEINGILAQIKVTQEQYDQTLAEGNVSFAAKDYEKAISIYKAALQLKPEEQLPKEKIAQAEAEIRKLNDNYATLIGEGDKKYTSKQYLDAIVLYQKALEIKPSEQYPKDQIAQINAVLEKKKVSEFPVGIVVNYLLPSASGPIVNKTELIQNKITPTLSLGYGVMAAYKFKLGRLGKFQVRTGLTLDNINFKSELVLVENRKENISDTDGYDYIRIIQLSNLTEDIKLSYFTIPLGLEKIFTLGKSGWALSLNAGVNFMYLSSAKYKSSADISYAGNYPDLYNLTINENGVYDFGRFAVTSSNSVKAKSSLISMDFGGGLSKRIGRMSMFAEFRQRISNTDLFEKKDLWSLSQNFLQLESTMNFKNSYNFRYNFLTFGLAFNL